MNIHQVSQLAILRQQKLFRQLTEAVATLSSTVDAFVMRNSFITKEYRRYEL